MSKQATATAPFVTPVVKDEEGRRLTRTMRRTDKLEDLMRYYYAMVPAVGVFLHRCRPLDYNQSPAEYGMKDGDEVEFVPDLDQRMLVTPVVVDFKGCRFTRTVRRTDTVQSVLDFYHVMVPTVPRGYASFIFEGRRFGGGRTLAEVELEDGDVVDIFHQQPYSVWAGTSTF